LPAGSGVFRLGFGKVMWFNECTLPYRDKATQNEMCREVNAMFLSTLNVFVALAPYKSPLMNTVKGASTLY